MIHGVITIILILWIIGFVNEVYFDVTTVLELNS